MIDRDAALSIVTGKDADGLEIIRHSTAHLLAQAVQAVYPEAQVTIGPVIEDGFYYDFAFSRPFTPEDLAQVRSEDARARARPTCRSSRRVMPRDEAVEEFKKLGEHYKAEIIASIPANEDISLYGQGDWFDLCRGPHVPSTGKLGAFKLMKVAGAYWRGDSKNEMLQRIYGTAWPDEKSAQGVPDAPRRSREARSPPPRPRARPVPHAGRGGRAACSGTRRATRSGATSRTTCATRLRRAGYVRRSRRRS